jgi:hypothetical protein
VIVGLYVDGHAVLSSLEMVLRFRADTRARGYSGGT